MLTEIEKLLKLILKGFLCSRYFVRMILLSGILTTSLIAVEGVSLIDLLGPEKLYPKSLSKNKVVTHLLSGESDLIFPQLHEHAALLNQEMKCLVLVEIAKLYFLNQDLHNSFRVYSSAIEEKKKLLTATSSDKEPSYYEKKLFDEIYTVYLQEDGQGVFLTSKVNEAIQSNPSYVSLLFFASSVKANNGNLIGFFIDFWSAFEAYPKSYLASKTQGNIYFRIYELSIDEKEREQSRSLALEYYLEAFNTEPRDVSLISRIMLLSRLSEQAGVVEKLLPALSRVEKPPSRGQCWILLNLVQQLNRPDLLKELHLILKKWFDKSRYLTEWEEKNKHNV